MKKQNDILFLSLGLLAVAIFLLLYVLFDEKKDITSLRETVVSRKIVKNVNESSRIQESPRVKSVKIDVKDNLHERPILSDVIGDDEDAPLSELAEKIVRDLQDSLDDNDLKSVRKVLVRFNLPESKGGLGGKIPKQLKLAAVAALGWFGPKAISGGDVLGGGTSSSSGDLIDYMVDADPEISDSAFDAFEESLSDFEIGDYQRSDLLKTILKAVSDSERVESLLSALDDMRNSVKADTIVSIMQNGTDAAKAAMKDQLEFYTEQDVTTVDDVLRWKAENPDDEGDNDFYGPSKD